MELRDKIIRFLAMSAWDILIPNTIGHPIALFNNFYDCFLVIDPAEKLTLLKESRDLSTQDIEAIIDAISADWQPHLRNGQLTESQRQLLRQLVLSLKATAQSNAVDNPDESLKKTLDGSLLSDTREPFVPPYLTPDQLLVGQSMVRAGLLGLSDGRGPRALPTDAPTIPGHELRSILANGGFSTVYLANDVASGELRAIKIGKLEDRRRFEREVDLLSKLQGPFVVKYFAHGELPGRFWIAMEHLGNCTLADIIRTRPSPDTALLLAEQILKGLVALHEKRIIHRDLKPNNVMADHDNHEFRLKLIDFGLARPLPDARTGLTANMTEGLNGAPIYMAPEQIRGTADITPAADLWAFGVVLYELFTGKPPFVSTNIMTLADEILNEKFQIDESKIPREIQTFVRQCFKQNAGERWLNAASALPVFSSGAKRACERMRQERYRLAWQRIYETRSLQRFAEEHKGVSPPDALKLFTALAQREGIANVEEDRLKTFLPAIVSHQSQIDSATLDLQTKADGFARKIAILSLQEFHREAAAVQRAKETAISRKNDLEEKITSFLSPLGIPISNSPIHRPTSGSQTKRQAPGDRSKTQDATINEARRRNRFVLPMLLMGGLFGLGGGFAMQFSASASSRPEAGTLIGTTIVGIVLAGLVYLFLRLIVAIVVRPKILVSLVVGAGCLWFCVDNSTTVKSWLSERVIPSLSGLSTTERP